MKLLLVILLAFTCICPSFGQTDSTAVQELLAYQQELNEAYKDPEKSPLPPEKLTQFSGHTFFEIDLAYRVQARFKRTAQEPVFKMQTSTDRLPEYVKYGELTFELHGQTHILNIYQNLALRKTEQYRNHLFLPFTDQTNGHTTYGGGRYLDLTIPEGETMLLDFNKAYNPYCAYAAGYSCPIPPKENNLAVAIPAGIRFDDKK
ncbi:DUF1684 domain-containing protein [Pontibacter qinzhouensis]|uniref:DUF1684 domain-containing protein n=1 Tax=Pontibacter qinzhouensis TaxID=2603253 RepID=A0A5C8K966_9BACT|nr:DUF1684 domain-containing protein [Pontibacter qinzhouensis]TXK45314.1 DUF1684 domain-containing protein [Pontibacter qinzhouensis]